MNINELDSISGSITNNTNIYHILRVPFNIEEILVCFCAILISFKLVLLVLLVVMLLVVWVMLVLLVFLLLCCVFYLHELVEHKSY